MTGGGDDARQQPSTRLRAGLLAVAVATALLVGGGSPAGASPVPAGAAAVGGYLYWSNTFGALEKPGDGVISRARLDGTDVNQKFVKTAQAEGPDAVVAGSGHLYWANDFSIGRANLNGTDVNQHFIADKDFINLHGVAVGPGRID